MVAEKRIYSTTALQNCYRALRSARKQLSGSRFRQSFTCRSSSAHRTQTIRAQRLSVNGRCIDICIRNCGISSALIRLNAFNRVYLVVRLE